ncbi:MAG: hypothetical protein AAGA30_11065, partial [Planctomycetota bacterium]
NLRDAARSVTFSSIWLMRRMLNGGSRTTGGKAEVLQLTEYSSVPGRFIFYQLDEAMLLLFNPDVTSCQAGRVGGSIVPPHGAVGEGHMAFEIAENLVPEWIDWLKTREVEIESIVQWPEVGQSIYFRDPAGNSIELATKTLWF